MMQHALYRPPGGGGGGGGAVAPPTMTLHRPHEYLQLARVLRLWHLPFLYFFWHTLESPAFFFLYLPTFESAQAAGADGGLLAPLATNVLGEHSVMSLGHSPLPETRHSVSKLSVLRQSA